jgi:hypothetical protein
MKVTALPTPTAAAEEASASAGVALATVRATLALVEA